MNPDIQIKANPISNLYSLIGLSGMKLVNAIIKRIRLVIQITEAKIQKIFTMCFLIKFKVKVNR
jgi:hypothetical protein